MNVFDCMRLLVQCISSVFNWFGMIVLRYDAWGWLIGGFTIYCAYRFLLSPLLGGRSIGDKGGKKSSSSKSESESDD